MTDYSTNELRSALMRYQELRSIAEQFGTSNLRERVNRNNVQGKQDIICILVDLDRAVSTLSGKQKNVIILVRSGQLLDEIAYTLNIRKSTVIYHFNNAIFRMECYLNNGPNVRIKNRRRNSHSI